MGCSWKSASELAKFRDGTLTRISTISVLVTESAGLSGAIEQNRYLAIASTIHDADGRRFIVY